MLFITGTLWGWVEARPGKQGLMPVVSHTAGLCPTGCSETALVAACLCRVISDPAFQVFPWLSVIKDRFHACESEVEMSKNCINPPLVSSVCSCLHPCVPV